MEWILYYCLVYVEQVGTTQWGPNQIRLVSAGTVHGSVGVMCRAQQGYRDWSSERPLTKITSHEEMHVWVGICSLIKSQRWRERVIWQHNGVLTFNLHPVIYWGHQLLLLKFFQRLLRLSVISSRIYSSSCLFLSRPHVLQCAPK